MLTIQTHICGKICELLTENPPETKPKLFNNTEASGEFHYLGLKKDLCFRFANRKIFFHAVQKFFIGKRQQLTKTANEKWETDQVFNSCHKNIDVLRRIVKSGYFFCPKTG